jgi:hypothetical protein
MQTVPCGDPNEGVCTTPVTETQTVWVSEDFTDAACARAIEQAPQDGAVYLLQFDFYAADRCTLACFRQWPQADGSFQNGPCEAPPAPSGQAAPAPRAQALERRTPVGGLDVN